MKIICKKGHNAQKMLQAKPVGYYDVILMDIQMPHMNGYQDPRQSGNCRMTVPEHQS